MSIGVFLLEELFDLLKFLGKGAVEIWKKVAPKAGGLLDWILKHLGKKGQPLPLPELKISLVAPSGFGKTSLLSTVMKEIDKTLTPTNLEKTFSLTVAADSEEDQRRIDENNKIIDKMISNGMVVTSGIKGGAGINKYKFNITMADIKQNQIKQPFSIMDAPGGFIVGDQPARMDEWENHLRESRILWMPINSAALMEASPKITREKLCQTELLKIHELNNWVEKWAKYHKKEITKYPCCIIYVPVKCEKYLSKGDKESRDNLYNKFKDYYGGIIKTVNDISPQIDQFYIPVETIGSIKLSDSEWKGNPDPEHPENKYEVKFEENYVSCGNYRDIKNADLLLKKIYEYAHDQIIGQIEEDKKSLEKIKNPLDIPKKVVLSQAINVLEKSLRPLIDEFGKNSRVSLNDYRV